MPTAIVSNEQEAKYLARKFRPVIWQRWKNKKDSITPIVLARYEDVEKLLPILIQHPTLYFSIREDKDWYYAFYMIFHPFDWSSHRWNFIRKLASHQFDTESLVFRIDKNNWDKQDIATVYHNQILFQKNATKYIYIEAEGHGIIPFNHKKIPKQFICSKKHKCKLYFRYQLVNLSKFTSNQWKQIRRALNGVNTPFEQADTLWLRSSFGIRHKKGDMFLRPDKLFEKAIETKRI